MRLWSRVCALGVALAGCVPPPSRVPEPEPQIVGGRTGAVVDTTPIVWTSGLHAVELPVVGQGSRSALVWIPEAAAPRAVVVFLHGRVGVPYGRTLDPLAASRAFVSCLAAPALGSLDPIIIAPSSSTGQWWAREETELVLGIVLAARSRWPAAGAHSVIVGYSNGGIGTWFFARLYPEYFSAAIPMAFNETVVGESRLPIYAIQGTKDEQFEFAPVRAAVLGLIARGKDVTLDEKYRGTHGAVCSYLPELSRAARWLEGRVLSRGGGPATP